MTHGVGARVAVQALDRRISSQEQDGLVSQAGAWIAGSWGGSLKRHASDVRNAQASGWARRRMGSQRHGLVQVVTNLLTNAAKYTRRGGNI